MPETPILYPIANPVLGEREKEYLSDCIDTHWISSSGKYISRFEEAFQGHFGPGFAVATSNGTISIDLALKALGVQPGDEVIVPNFTFVGSVSPIYRLQAIPVLAPCSQKSWNVDVNSLEALITKKTKAIIAVHLYGIPCDIEALMAIAKKHGLKVVEDCAESLGAKVNGQLVGTFGDVGCFSFFGNKVLTTGEGGMCLARDEKLAELIRLYRDHGMTKEYRYWHRVIGYNGRMTNLQAAIGLAQCETIVEQIERRNEIHAIYEKHFSSCEALRQIEIVEKVERVCWLESPVLKANCDMNREPLLNALGELGIETRPFFYPCSSMPAFSRFGHDDDHSTDYASHGFNLPTYVKIKDDEVDMIAKSVCDLAMKQYKPDSAINHIFRVPDVVSQIPIDVSVILPTFNEADHIVALIEALISSMISVAKEYEILVMDDESQDGTVEKIKSRFSNDPKVKVVIRQHKEKGLTNSIFDGVKQAKGQYILIMDSDFNHDPGISAQMVKMTEFYDLVSGSRYTTGGGTKNRLAWWCGLLFNMWIRLLLWLPTQDNLSGYFCVRQKILEELDLDKIFRNRGDYYFRLLYQARKKHFKILELPFVSNDRGPSKKPFLTTLMLYIKESLKLRLKI